MATGSGTGTPIAPSAPADAEGVYDALEELRPRLNCAVPLARYATIIGVDECAFWGITYSGQNGADLWSEFQRQQIAQALAEAQADMELTVGYPLCPTWVVGTPSEEPDNDVRWVDQQAYRLRQVTRYGHLLAVGAYTSETVEAEAELDHSSDPAVVGPLATDATAATEIKVFYPGSGREITPSAVTLSGGQVTIQIPRCRLVKADRLNWDDGGLEYEDSNNFLSTVDVAREYANPARQAVLVRAGCTNGSCDNGGGECTQDACVYVQNWEVGIVAVRPAEYADGTWSPRTLAKHYETVRLYYQAGVRRLPPSAESAIVRLAHAKSPEAPCACAKTEHLWRRDRHVPEVLTAERLNCPFGLSDGAWSAYRMALRLRQWRMGGTELTPYHLRVPRGG